MTRDQLIASLTAGREDVDGVYFDGDPDGAYIDWSSPLRHPEDRESVIGRRVEVGDGEDTAQIDMTWDRIERLQRALTLLLLERES